MKKLLLPTLVLIFIYGCAIQPKIDTDTDRTYSLSSYKSFSLESLEMEDEPSQISVNPILLQRVSRSIEQKLISRKLISINSDQPIGKIIIDPIINRVFNTVIG